MSLKTRDRLQRLQREDSRFAGLSVDEILGRFLDAQWDHDLVADWDQQTARHAA